ncbi:MAG: hypothetical protein WD009_15030 [Phycisphaeraceae bacterium]
MLMIAVPLTLIVSLTAGVFIVRSITGAMFPSEVTDVGQYDEILSDWRPTGQVDHFPIAIPAQANNVRLSSFPGFLQGGAHFQVRMELPRDEVQALALQIGHHAIHRYTGGGMFDHYNDDQQGNVPTTWFHTSAVSTQPAPFPDHYTLFVLDARDHASGAWNHGRTSGIAISTANSEVIYWAESW